MAGDGAALSMHGHGCLRMESPRVASRGERRIGHAHRDAVRGTEDPGSECRNEAAGCIALEREGRGGGEEEEEKEGGKSRTQIKIASIARRASLAVTASLSARSGNAPTVKKGGEDIIEQRHVDYEEKKKPKPVNKGGRHGSRDENSEPWGGLREKHPRKCKAPTPPKAGGIRRPQQRRRNRGEGATNNDGADHGETVQSGTMEKKGQRGAPGGNCEPRKELRERYPRKCKKQLSSMEDALGAQMIYPPHGMGTEGKGGGGDRLSNRTIKKTGSEVEINWVGPVTRSMRKN